jgi:hypothetical protein
MNIQSSVIWIQADASYFDESAVYNTTSLWNLGSHNDTQAIDNILRLSPGKLTGTWTSPVIDISSLGSSAPFSRVVLGQSEEGRRCLVETNISLDGGSTWEGWKYQHLYIFDMPPGTDVSNGRLQVRISMDDAGAGCPTRVDALWVDFYTFPELTKIDGVSMEHIAKVDGVGKSHIAYIE